jgi:hypothetical protein
VSPDCAPDCLQQVFAVKRFGQKVYCAALDCPHRHRDVTVTSEKDNGNPYILPRQFILQFKAVKVGKLDIQDQTARHFLSQIG